MSRDLEFALGLPDKRLDGLIESYGFYAAELVDHMTVGTGLIAFNISGTRLEIDGRQRDAGAVFGLPMDPVFVRYSKGEGAITTIRIVPGAFDRMFGIDMMRGKGVVEVDPATHPIMAKVSEQLFAAPHSPVEQFRALDHALLTLLPDAKPAGFAERFWHYSSDRDGDVKVAEAAKELGCTIRMLERACSARFGRSPKRIARGIRASRTHQLSLDTSERPELLAEFSYADLPHFLNDMRRITGMNRRQLDQWVGQGEDLPFRLFWPGGSEAVSDGEREEWMADMASRGAPQLD